MGHKDVRTTMIHTHVLNRGGRGVKSPADTLWEQCPEGIIYRNYIGFQANCSTTVKVLLNKDLCGTCARSIYSSAGMWGSYIETI